MAIVDAQARWMIPHVLRDTLMLYESDVPFTFERADDPLCVGNFKETFIEPETGRRFHGLVFVAISEKQETIRLLAEWLEKHRPK